MLPISTLVQSACSVSQLNRRSDFRVSLWPSFDLPGHYPGANTYKKILSRHPAPILALGAFCRPCLSFSMGSAGLRPSGGSSGYGEKCTGSLHTLPRRAIGSLLIQSLVWGQGATLTWREPCRPYQSFSMGNVGLRPSEGSIGNSERSTGRLHTLPRKAVGAQPSHLQATGQGQHCHRPYRVGLTIRLIWEV